MLLEKEGLVDIPPRRRPCIASLAIDEVRDIYRARCFVRVDRKRCRSLGRTGGHRSAARSTHRDGAYLPGQRSQWLRLGECRLYDRNTQLANDRAVKRILDSLLLRTLSLRRLSLSRPGRMQKSLDDHIRLMKAYENRDANLAAALIRSNHINAFVALEKCLPADKAAE